VDVFICAFAAAKPNKKKFSLGKNPPFAAGFLLGWSRCRRLRFGFTRRGERFESSYRAVAQSRRGIPASFYKTKEPGKALLLYPRVVACQRAALARIHANAHVLWSYFGRQHRRWRHVYSVTNQTEPKLRRSGISSRAREKGVTPTGLMA